LNEEHIVDIACGPTHSAALNAAGQLYVWGSSTTTGTSSSGAVSASLPLLTAGISQSHWVQVACGSDHCTLLLVSSSGELCHEHCNLVIALYV